MPTTPTEPAALSHAPPADAAVRSVDLTARDRLWLVGADAPTFLNRLLTRDTVKLAEGRGGRAFVLDVRGRVEVALRLFRLPPAADAAPRFVADCAPGHGAVLTEVLDRYHFGERIEVRPAPLVARALLANAHSAGSAQTALRATLDALGLPAVGPDQAVAAQLAGRALWLIGAARTEADVDLWFAPEDAAAVDAALAAAGVAAASPDDLHRARVLAGVPAAGGEYGAHATPLDVHPALGLTDGKGCYPGQEVIERTLALGRPAQILRGLWLAGPAEPGAAVLDGASAIGHLTSVAALPDGRHAALALLKRRHADAPGPFAVAPPAGALATDAVAAHPRSLAAESVE